MIALEDFHEDILGKAMRGLGIGKNEMAQILNLEKSKIEQVLNGAVDEALIKRMSKELKLDDAKLIRSARKEWAPVPVVVNGLKQFESSFGEMFVNAYVIWDDVTQAAWIFDTGTDSQAMLKFLDEKKLKVDAIFLTHTHRDHVACLDLLVNYTEKPKIYVHELEIMDRCVPIDEKFKHSVNSLYLETRHTHGHSEGGMTYLIKGLERPVAIVGDAIFAGSMGGGMVSYDDALRTNKEKILSLSEDTILCPGHGPMTTISEEKANNPFFPDFS